MTTADAIAQDLPHRQSAAVSQIVEERLSEEMFVTLKKGEIGRFRQLLAISSNPDAKNKEGYSLLMVAVKENAEDAVEALIGAYADINMGGPGGITAMMLAWAGGNIEIAKILMREYADVSGIDTVEEAREHGRPDLALLIEQKKQSEVYQKGVEIKKKEIEKAQQERQSQSIFSNTMGNIGQGISSFFTAAAERTRTAKEYVYDMAETAKEKTIAGAIYTKELCSAFAKSTACKAHATKEYTKQIYSRYFGENTIQTRIATEITSAALEVMEHSHFPPAEAVVELVENTAVAKMQEQKQKAPAPQPPTFV